MSQVHDPEPWRSRFPILQGTKHPVNHSLGAMPAGVAKRLQGYAERWVMRGARTWSEGDGLRVSPHFYTRKSELEGVADAPSGIRKTSAWRKPITQSAGY